MLRSYDTPPVIWGNRIISPTPIPIYNVQCIHNYVWQKLIVLGHFISCRMLLEFVQLIYRLKWS